MFNKQKYIRIQNLIKYSVFKNYKMADSWYHGNEHFWICGTTRNGSSDCPTVHLQKNEAGPLGSSFFSYMECH